MTSEQIPQVEPVEGGETRVWTMSMVSGSVGTGRDHGGGARAHRAYRNILTLLLCPIGDTLFATPALRALRESFPYARITAVAWRSNAAVLRESPFLDELVDVAGAAYLPRVVGELAARGFDLVVGLSHVGSWLTLFFPEAERIGFSGQTLGRRYTVFVPDDRDIHAVEYCLRVVGAVGAVTPDRSLAFPLREVHLARARRLLDMSLPEGWAAESRSGRAPLVAIHPGGRFFPAKRWPPERFAEVADRLSEEFGARIVVVGGRDDTALAWSIASAMRHPCTVAAGRTGLGETAGILRFARLFIGNDSAPLHLAVAVGTPSIGLFGPSDPRNFHPWGPGHVTVRVCTCEPCFRWLGGARQYLLSLGRGEGYPDCMLRITPDHVLRAARELLGGLGDAPPAPAGSRVLSANLSPVPR